jgi:Radical SAM superfamily/B12 binding domain
MKIRNALLLYPSQFYCPDPATAPIVVKTQFLKLLRCLRDHGARADIVDLELEFGRPTTSAECDKFLAMTRSRIAGKSYDFIGISCYSSMSYLSTLAVSRLARELYPTAIIAVGGYHALGKPEDFAGEAQIDFIVRGSGVKFLHALHDSAALERVCAFEGLSESLKETPYDEYPYRHRGEPAVAHLQLSQGCPFQCHFCCEPFIGNSKYDPLDVDAALAEIDRAINMLAPRKVVIEDVIFGFNARWRYEFLTRLRERACDQVFWVEMRADTLTEKTVALLAEMNVYITVGLESLSPSTLKYMNKTANPDRYLRSFRESVALANRFQLPVTYSIMLNYPGETWQSYSETMEGIESTITPDPRGQSHEFDFYEFAFFPGNTTYQTVDKLRDQCGCEVCDPEWYKSTAGDMLELSTCRVPSRDLVEHVGESQVHSYFLDRLEQINRRCKPTTRSFLLRNWRFVESLRDRYPSAKWNSVYSQTGSANHHAMQEQIAQMAQLHDALTNVWVRRSESEHPASWWTRNAIWHDALDIICERADDPLRPDTKMQSRLVEHIDKLLAEPDGVVPSSRKKMPHEPLLAE